MDNIQILSAKISRFLRLSYGDLSFMLNLMRSTGYATWLDLLYLHNYGIPIISALQKHSAVSTYGVEFEGVLFARVEQALCEMVLEGGVFYSKETEREKFTSAYDSFVSKLNPFRS